MKSNFRNSITVPEKCWARFRDIFNDYWEKMKKTPDANLLITAADNDHQQHQQQSAANNNNNSLK